MNKDKLSALQAAGKVAGALHTEIGALIRPGLNLLEIEELAEKRIKEAGMKPAFLGYHDYPAVTCLSVNDEIVHGLPRDYILEEGDVLKVDLGVSTDGWLVDTARTHGVGKITPQAQNLLDVTRQALEEAIKLCRVGQTTGDIGAVIEKTVKSAGCAVVPDLAGHGVGRTLQEEPSIMNYGKPGGGVALKEGMVLAIEPITSTKPTKIAILSDDWTIIAENGALTAQFEHTIIITDNEPIVLTR